MPNIGIDLGTTNSLVAVVMDGKARCLLDEEGASMLPSAVRYEGEGVVVGREARDEAPAHAGSTFTSVKRFMGRAPADCQADAALFRYRMDDTESRFVRFLVDGHAPVTPVEVSAEILRSLKKRSVECLFGEPGGAVITVPAYFDDAQRQATKDAARVAGIEVLRLLNEPTAAAIAYGLDKRGTGTFAVYDLGGGTFDISILRLDDGVFQVLSTAGDTHLGGDDFDRALADLAWAQILEQDERANSEEHRRGLLTILERTPSRHRALLLAARAAKHALTTEHRVYATLEPGLGASVSRQQFEAAIRPVVERTGAACKRALSDAGLSPGEIDAVVLVGGSTRVPLVRQYVAELFGREPYCELDPDEVVALGAAMQADLLSGQSSLGDDILLLDVIPLSLGLEVMGGVTEKFIPRCSTIPVNASHTFTTHVDGQTAVDLHVVQGDRELVKDNRSLGRFELRGLPRMPAGVPRVKVDFLVDADGLLRVSAREEHTGIEAQIEVKPSYGLSEADIERMLEDAIDHAETDVDERLLIEARVEAEGILAALDKALAADRALLGDEEAGAIEGVASALREAMVGADRERISTLSKDLDAVSAPFAQRRIERDLTQALSGRDAEVVGAELGLR
ncbi:MAG: Fe-S protein assembly chaperone HscA [Deltaproteobacteria bacterium]|nr:Fe-S protein assembly chaperone HscA [Deltaproteobacteria bacterium]